MQGWMQGQVAVVTGGGSGIGRGVVDAFVREGARVGILEIDSKKADDLTAAYGDSVSVVCGDVTSYATNQELVAKTVRAFGKVDTLVCVAGLWDYATKLLDLPPDRLGVAFDEIFSVNVKAYLYAVKATVDELLRNHGSIILTASNAAFYPGGGGVLYTGSKFAVRGLITQLAFELAPTVRVNGVAPGGTVTSLRGLAALDQTGLQLTDIPDLAQMIARDSPLQFAAEPVDHASAYVYLAAEGRARAVTGTVIQSDGGIGIRGISRHSGILT